MLSPFSNVPVLRNMGKKSGLNIAEAKAKVGSNGRFEHKFIVEVETDSGDVHPCHVLWHMSC